MIKPLEILAKGHYKSLIAALLYFDFSFMVWVSLGALGAFIASDLGLSPGQKGLMVALPLLSGSAFRLAFGAAVDYWGPKKTGLLGLALTAVPLFMIWQLKPSYPLLLGCGVLLGVAGASFVVAIPLASRHYPPEAQGLVMGLAGAGNSGTVFAALLLPWLATLWGWQDTFGAAMGLGLLVLLMFGWMALEPPVVAQHQSIAERWKGLLKEPRTLRYCSRYLVSFGGFVGLASFLPIYFHDQHNMAPLDGARLTGLCVLVGSLTRPLGGALADRWGSRLTLRFLFGAVALFGIVAARPWGMPSAGFVMIALLGALGLCNGALFQRVPREFGPARMGAITGLMGAAGGLGGFFLPTLLGQIRGLSGSFAWAFLFWALAALWALPWRLESKTRSLERLSEGARS